jgi:hypothetical protein
MHDSPAVGKWGACRMLRAVLGDRGATCDIGVVCATTHPPTVLQRGPLVNVTARLTFTSFLAELVGRQQLPSTVSTLTATAQRPL